MNFEQMATNTEKRIAEIEAKLNDTWWLTIQRDDTEWLIAELRASQAECEKIEHQRRRLSSCLTGAEADLGVVANERDAARAQLAEAVELLRQVDDWEDARIAKFLAKVKS